jgi:hypothetical protein
MSTSIYWSPVPSGNLLPTSTPNRVLDILEDILGERPPYSLTRADHYDYLIGIIAGVDDGALRQVFTKLKEALIQYPEIYIHTIS